LCVADLLGDVADINNAAGVKLRPVIDHENDVGPRPRLYCRGDPRLNVIGVDRLWHKLDAERFVAFGNNLAPEQLIGCGHEIGPAQPMQGGRLGIGRRPSRRKYSGGANGPGRNCTGTRKLQQPASSYACHDLPPCNASDAFRFL
jgi:hypothetical protein